MDTEFVGMGAGPMKWWPLSVGECVHVPVTQVCQKAGAQYPSQCGDTS